MRRNVWAAVRGSQPCVWPAGWPIEPPPLPTSGAAREGGSGSGTLSGGERENCSRVELGSVHVCVRDQVCSACVYTRSAHVSCREEESATYRRGALASRVMAVRLERASESGESGGVRSERAWRGVREVIVVVVHRLVPSYEIPTSSGWLATNQAPTPTPTEPPGGGRPRGPQPPQPPACPSAAPCATSSG